MGGVGLMMLEGIKQAARCCRKVVERLSQWSDGRPSVTVLTGDAAFESLDATSSNPAKLVAAYIYRKLSDPANYILIMLLGGLGDRMACSSGEK